MPMNCKRCGATLAEGSRFCTVCGATLAPAISPESKPAPSDSPRNCSYCGKPLIASEKFCTKCGRKVPDSKPAAWVQQKTGKCTNCGNTSNPADSNYCIRCGQPLIDLGGEETQPVEETPSAEATEEAICPNCDQSNRPGTKFCVFCGTPITHKVAAVTTVQETGVIEDTRAEQPEGVLDTEKAVVDDIEPIPIPNEVLAVLIARGRQLSLEEEYAKRGENAEQVVEELSQAAGDGDFALEELLDTYINEQAEQDRLDQLKKSGEVSERVFERLSSEYDEKLAKMDDDIEKGIGQLHGYVAQLNRESAQTKDEIETIEARVLVGDTEENFSSKKKKLVEKQEHLSFALTAAHHILNKDATRRGEAVSRFEVAETTLADTSLVEKEREEAPEEITDDAVEKEPEQPSIPTSAGDAEAGKICTQCGRVTASDAKFCVHCGSPL